MARARSGIVRKRRVKKTLERAKGFYGNSSRQVRTAKPAVMRALSYAYRDRRDKKSMYRSLWNVRINAGARECGLSYSKLINGMKKAGIILNRKMLSNLAIEDAAAFKAVVALAQKHLG
ncbi:MAG: 50S ribosomal protein L20 [Spirochaetes bacterium]|nr:50S ribosomal protein L20 [Spirochaetota bacterium]